MEASLFNYLLVCNWSNNIIKMERMEEDLYSHLLGKDLSISLLSLPMEVLLVVSLINNNLSNLPWEEQWVLQWITLIRVWLDLECYKNLNLKCKDSEKRIHN
jgi:hypothetical protein